MKNITQIDARLTEVDSAILAEYEKQLQQLSELHIPHSAPEEAYITEEEEEEEEEDKSDQGSHVGDKGREEVLV
jgi:hypothetical protein